MSILYLKTIIYLAQMLSHTFEKLGKPLLENNQIYFKFIKFATRNFSQNEEITEGLRQFPVFSIKPSEGKF